MKDQEILHSPSRDNYCQNICLLGLVTLLNGRILVKKQMHCESGTNPMMGRDKGLEGGWWMKVVLFLSSFCLLSLGSFAQFILSEKTEKM